MQRSVARPWRAACGAGAAAGTNAAHRGERLGGAPGKRSLPAVPHEAAALRGRNCSHVVVLKVMRQTLKAALIGAMIIVLAEGGMAATIMVHAPDGEGRVFVDVVGKINDGDFETFKEKTDQIYPIGASHPKKQVIVTLMSYGGSINPALQIGDVIRKRSMFTFVPGDRTCASACALIWLAGAPRAVGDTPQIGFHAAFDPDSRRETGAANAVVGAYLRDLGFGYKAIVFMTRKGPTSLEWLTPDLAKELGGAWVDASAAESNSHSATTEVAAPPKTASPSYCGVVQIGESVADCEGSRVTEALVGKAGDLLIEAGAAAGHGPAHGCASGRHGPLRKPNARQH